MCVRIYISVCVCLCVMYGKGLVLCVFHIYMCVCFLCMGRA